MNALDATTHTRFRRAHKHAPKRLAPAPGAPPRGGRTLNSRCGLHTTARVARARAVLTASRPPFRAPHRRAAPRRAPRVAPCLVLCRASRRVPRRAASCRVAPCRLAPCRAVPCRARAPSTPQRRARGATRRAAARRARAAPDGRCEPAFGACDWPDPRGTSRASAHRETNQGAANPRPRRAASGRTPRVAPASTPCTAQSIAGARRSQKSVGATSAGGSLRVRRESKRWCSASIFPTMGALSARGRVPRNASALWAPRGIFPTVCACTIVRGC